MAGKIFKYQVRAACFYWVWLPGMVIGTGVLLDRIFGFARWPGSFLCNTFAVLLLGVGGGLISKAHRDLAIIGGGTPSPAQPAKKLVMGGSYTICRHPMHLGYIVAALGVVLLCRSQAMLFICYPIFLGWQIWFLKKEEIFLAKRFGNEFTLYQQKVSLILPFIHKK